MAFDLRKLTFESIFKTVLSDFSFVDLALSMSSGRHIKQRVISRPMNLT